MLQHTQKYHVFSSLLAVREQMKEVHAAGYKAVGIKADLLLCLVMSKTQVCFYDTYFGDSNVILNLAPSESCHQKMHLEN